MRTPIIAANLLLLPLSLALTGCGKPSLDVTPPLTTIGQATYGGDNYNLVWDQDSSLIWLNYTNVGDTWYTAKAWAAGLNNVGILSYTLDSRYSGINWSGDWRLPNNVEEDVPSASLSFNGTTSFGYNNTKGELGHLNYSELGNKGYSNYKFTVLD